MSTIPGIEQVHGFARQGQSVIYLNFRWVLGIVAADGDEVVMLFTV